MNLVPGLSLRASAAEEEEGLDDNQLGEFAYDYVELRRETGDVIEVGYGAVNSQRVSSSSKNSHHVTREEAQQIHEKV